MIKQKTKILMNKKKAQMKIQQTAFLLLAVTLLFIMAGIFVLMFKVSDFKKAATALEEKNAVLLVSKLANSPEFSCENAFGVNRINCVDADKVMMLKNSTAYRRFWGVKNIEIRKLYPETSNEECSITNYPNCNEIRIWPEIQGNYTAIGNFVALCRKEKEPNNNEAYDKCEMAILMVDYEKKQ